MCTSEETNEQKLVKRRSTTLLYLDSCVDRMDSVTANLVLLPCCSRRQTNARFYHRTAALLSLVALSAAASGAKMPAFYGGDDGGSADWAAYLARALNIDLLSRHFIGIGSALLCM